MAIYALNANISDDFYLQVRVHKKVKYSVVITDYLMSVNVILWIMYCI